MNPILKEVTYLTSRSGGKGGQNVNKVETKVILCFDVDASIHLTEEQKERIKKVLKNKINDQGILQITAQVDRSQLANKKIAAEKLELLIAKALAPKKKRIATAVSKAAKEKRKETKQKLSEKKERRRIVDGE